VVAVTQGRGDHANSEALHALLAEHLLLATSLTGFVALTEYLKMIEKTTVVPAARLPLPPKNPLP
jgi:hypothetical protein